MRDATCSSAELRKAWPSSNLVGFVWLNGKCIPWGSSLLVSVHDHHKAVSGGLWPDVDPRVLPPQQVLDERGLAWGNMQGRSREGRGFGGAQGRSLHGLWKRAQKQRWSGGAEVLCLHQEPQEHGHASHASCAVEYEKSS